jgi:hypothetical protein
MSPRVFLPCRSRKHKQDLLAGNSGSETTRPQGGASRQGSWLFLLRPLSPPIRRGLRVALPAATSKLVTYASAAGKRRLRSFSHKPKKGWTIHFKLVMKRRCRDVAQLGRALRSGRRSRAFKSRHPDHFYISFPHKPACGPQHFPRVPEDRVPRSIPRPRPS